MQNNKYVGYDHVIRFKDVAFLKMRVMWTSWQLTADQLRAQHGTKASLVVDLMPIARSGRFSCMFDFGVISTQNKSGSESLSQHELLV